MKWEVKGANAMTGADKTLVGEAASAEAAEKIAGLAGLLVETVATLTAITPPAMPSLPIATQTSVRAGCVRRR